MVDYNRNLPESESLFGKDNHTSIPNEANQVSG
jgi:hypothetical protein